MSKNRLAIIILAIAVVIAGIIFLKGQKSSLPADNNVNQYNNNSAQISDFTSPQCLIKGNISYKTGEKIYHLLNCPNYYDTVINKAYGERWFCSEAEARAAGWRKAKNCP